MPHGARKAFAHVYWLGGSACAGKTSVARLVAAAHGLALYSCDERFEEHRRRADPARHPRFCRIMDLSAEELWERPAEVQAAELLGFYEDEMEMILEDLAAFPGQVLAEGVGLLPDRVAEVLAEPWQAVWLAATPELRRRASPERVQEALSRCPDPERAFSRWMERDALVAATLEQAARSRGLDILVVDGRCSVEENAADVARRLRLRES